MKARVARFYGWNHDHIQELPVQAFYQYLRAIDVLTSEEQLRYLQVEFAPHIKPEKRKELVNELKARIKSSVDRTGGRLATVADLAKAFAGMIKNG